MQRGIEPGQASPLKISIIEETAIRWSVREKNKENPSGGGRGRIGGHCRHLSCGAQWVEAT